MNDKDGERRPSLPHGRRQPPLRSFINASAGIAYSVRTQRNVRIHLAITALVLLASVVLRVSVVEFAVLLLCIMVVVVAEMLNTALECVVDLVTDDYHHLAKLAKDVSAGAVFVASIGAACIGGVIFLPRAWTLVFADLTLYIPAINPMGKLV